MHDDLRDWLQKADAIGKLKRVDGADWDMEIGAATALNLKGKDCSALLFDDIKDYPKGHRVVTCTGSGASLVSLILNLPVADSDFELLNVLREKLPEWEANRDKFPPEVVSTGPILENVLSGDDVDLLKFPVPKWHSLDGGRYIGTGHAVITKDPETGEVNLGTYRLQALDRKTTGWFMMPNQHGDIHRRKYHDRGERCPIAVSVGHHPLMFRVGCIELPAGAEYQFAGAIRGEPVKVITEEITGLPIPADAEIVLAGWCPPNAYRTEGPFGEWTGYYGRQGKTLTIEVERIYYRNNPIIVGSPHDRPQFTDGSYFRDLFRGIMLHRELVKSGIPGVKGVWLCRAGGPMLVFISLKQMYAGHARQAAILVSQNRSICRQGVYVVVVDDDIDPTSTEDVLWAMCSRADPYEDINIIRGTPSDQLNPRVPRDARTLVNSTAIIDACKPYEWINEFPVSLTVAPEVRERVRAKWKGLF